MPLFYYLLDIAICNAYILSEHYRKSRPAYNPKKHIRSTHRAFRGALIDDLMIQYKIAPVRIYRNPQHLPIRRLDRPYNLHQKTKTSCCGRCHFCRFKKDMQEKRLGHMGDVGSSRNVRQTQVMCQYCDVYLCAKCFLFSHGFKSIL
jgi:hypothetical protein